MGLPRTVRPAGLIAAAAFALPLSAALLLGVGSAFDARGWAALAADSQLPAAVALSLWTGLSSTLLALALALWLVTHLHGTPAWRRLQSALGSLLAVPHAAFAIGLVLLLMPSGLLARMVGAVLGWDAPPDVATVQDRFGLGLIAALVLKELPFLLWNIATLLHRPGQHEQTQRTLQLAASLGYPAHGTWWRVLWPQLLPRLALPVLAVWAYGATVVDMALVIGPTRPPTLGVLAWQWLLDADVQRNAQGAAAAAALTLGVAGVALLAALAWPGIARAWCRRAARGDRPALRGHTPLAAPAAVALGALYATVLALLLLVSFAGVWSFPSIWPQQWAADAWSTVLSSASTLVLTATLAALSAATGLLLAIAWLESTPAHWDRRAMPWLFAPMLVPGVLLVAGLYRLTLWLGADGRFAGLWLAHTLFTAPYAVVALAPAHRSFDPRLEQVAQSLGRGRAAFLWRIKGPMLLLPLVSAFAIGFAVSVAQYLSTQFVGAGRHATLTTEAVALAAGGQRTLAAAFGLAQALLPALVFGVALAIGRHQQRRLGGGAGG